MAGAPDPAASHVEALIAQQEDQFEVGSFEPALSASLSAWYRVSEYLDEPAPAFVVTTSSHDDPV